MQTMISDGAMHATPATGRRAAHRPASFPPARDHNRDTVVLLHSSASSARQWSALARSLHPHFEVHTPDLWGHGARPAWPHAQSPTLADEAALVAPMLAQAGRVHLVGHSFGGAVALKVAQLHPESVASVTVYEPTLFGWLRADDPDGPVLREVIDVAATMRRALERGNAYRAAERFLDYWAGAGTWASMPGARRDAAAQRMRAVLGHFDGLIAEDFAGLDARAFEGGILFLCGDRTVASAARVVALAGRRLPGAHVEVLPGLGHMGPVTHADRVNARIQRTLARFSSDRDGASVPLQPKLAAVCE